MSDTLMTDLTYHYSKTRHSLLFYMCPTSRTSFTHVGVVILQCLIMNVFIPIDLYEMTLVFIYKEKNYITLRTDLNLVQYKIDTTQTWSNRNGKTTLNRNKLTTSYQLYRICCVTALTTFWMRVYNFSSGKTSNFITLQGF